jgi:hypothetical protein
VGFGFLWSGYPDVRREIWEASNGLEKIVNRLKIIAKFRAVVRRSERWSLRLAKRYSPKAATNCRPTYAEAILHGPHKDGHSTTNAGAHLESVIAQKIIETVRSLLSAASKKEHRSNLEVFPATNEICLGRGVFMNAPRSWGGLERRV